MQIKHLHFESIDSTNEWAKKHQATCHKDLLYIITADTQTAGRGRNGNVWLSPAKHNVYATFLFFLAKHQKDLANLSQIMALAAAEAIESFGVYIQLKWPNDLLIGQKKVAGILTEIIQEADHVAVALGIGINANADHGMLTALPKPATSLFVETQTYINIEQLVHRLTQAFIKRLIIFKEEGFSSFLAAYRQKIVHRYQQELVYSQHHQLIKGKFVQIAADGTLQLILDNGETKFFASGDIIY